MKNTLFAIAAALSLAACTADYVPEETPKSVKLSFRTFAPSTRTIAGSGDKSVSSLQIFVFTASGYLEANTPVITESYQGLPNVDISPGVKQVWAVANVDDDLVQSYEINTVEDFLSLTVDITEQASAQDLVMSGYIESVTVKEDYTVDIDLKRLTAKVVIDQIERAFTDPDLARVSLKICGIYLSNVAGECDFACSSTSTIWYNQKGVKENLGCDLICHDITPVEIAQNGTYSTSHTLYPFPNPVKENTYGGSGWSNRRTRLVVECLFGGETCYYPITLPKISDNPNLTLDRNTLYHITKLTLKRPGSPDPDIPNYELEPEMNYSFEISVEDWDNVDPYIEVFN